MTSILSNLSATTALATLRSISNQLAKTATETSTGFRITTASDNAAYWSISTTMRSDSKAMGAVSDALGLEQAKIDTAYTGINAAIDITSKFKSALVAATEDGVDRNKIQADLDQYKEQLISISQSASYSGQNWLSTDIEDIYDSTENGAPVMSSFVRNADGSVAVLSNDLSLSDISLFNTTEGGLLQKDPRSPGSIGGLRNADTSAAGTAATQSGYQFTDPLVFTDDTTAISFDLTVDADNPSTTSSPGAGTTVSVTVNRSLVDSVDSSLNGIISTVSQFQQVMNAALVPVGGRLSTSGSNYSLSSTETSGNPGASISLANVTSTLASSRTGGLVNSAAPAYGARPSVSVDWDRAFTVRSTVQINVPVQVNGTTTTLVIDKALVNDALGTTTGEVTSSADLAAVLNVAMTAQGVGATATDTGDGVKLQADEMAGSKASIGIGPATDNLGNVANLGIEDIDISSSSANIGAYLDGVEAMLKKLVKAGSVLGSAQARVSMQSDFVSRLTDSIDQGVGRLVDADMEETSTRLNALQTQQQLAIQSLGIANSQPQAILSLFR